MSRGDRVYYSLLSARLALQWRRKFTISAGPNLWPERVDLFVFPSPRLISSTRARLEDNAL